MSCQKKQNVVSMATNVLGWTHKLHSSVVIQRSVWPWAVTRPWPWPSRTLRPITSPWGYWSFWRYEWICLTFQSTVTSLLKDAIFIFHPKSNMFTPDGRSPWLCWSVSCRITLPGSQSCIRSRTSTCGTHTETPREGSCHERQRGSWHTDCHMNLSCMTS